MRERTRLGRGRLAVVAASMLTVGACVRSPPATPIPRAVEPPRCTPNRIGAGWVERRSGIADVTFCVPPALELVQGRQIFATPAANRPYPRAQTTLDAAEYWNAPDGRPMLEMMVYTGPDEPEAWAGRATDVQTIRVSAGCAGDTAVLRQYRVPAVWNRPEPGAGERADTHNAHIVVSLGALRKMTIEVVGRDTVERAALIPILRSACTRGP